MSSGFVSAGSGETRTEDGDDWLKAQRAIEQSRMLKPEQGKQEGGKSLYEVLQQNKTAKQEAFEESLRLKNQYRTLDDDEVDFLDSVLESTRAREQEVKKETAEQLDAFRKQREAAEKALSDEKIVTSIADGTGDSPATEESWATSIRKRRRIKEKSEEGAIKLLKRSSATDTSKTKLLAEPRNNDTVGNEIQLKSVDHRWDTTGTANPRLKDVKALGPSSAALQTGLLELGLGAYSSDED